MGGWGWSLSQHALAERQEYTLDRCANPSQGAHTLYSHTRN
uniref:Uncharacterized protein n=1 Tax=Anguilla anguilla TaxID=7936 RepID=A0A0E9UJ79_ANGAN